jgi:hypothetical protein
VKRFIIGGLVVVVMAALSMGLASDNSRAAKDPFVGAWWSTDGDGSYQRVSIGGGSGGVYHVAYFDDWATVCGGGQATVIGSGSADGYVLQTESLPVHCLRQHFIWGYAQWSFTYDPTTDTLGSWVTWYRIGH